MITKIRCPSCGVDNASGQVECRMCGKQLPSKDSSIECQNCYTVNPISNSSCSNCQGPLTLDVIPEEQDPDEESDDAGDTVGEFTVAENRIRPYGRYPALRSIATSLQAFAYVILVLIGIGAIIALAKVGFAAFIAVLVVGGICGAMSWIFLKSWSELIYVQMDIEENTRRIAEGKEKVP